MSAKTVPCEVCRGEKIVAYIQSAGGFSEPAPCYKCEGTGRLIMADLRRCPLCNVKIGEPFENLRDNGDDDEPTKVWTIHHYCLGIDLWISGADAEECLNRWNSLTGHRAVNAHAGLVKALSEAKTALMCIRACSIVGAEQGYGRPELWGDNLYRSHGNVAAAIKTIDTALAAAGVKP